MRFRNYFLILCICFALLNNTSAQTNLNIKLLGHLSYGSMNLSNLWGYTDDAGNEYALVGAGDGLSIVSLKNPAAPVEITRIPGPKSAWREVRTWGKYVYVTTEAAGGGLLIVDLSTLPDKNVKHTTWKPTIKGAVLSTIHALHAADGRVYLYGSNIGKRGAIIIDVSKNPMNPEVLGLYEGYYVHDGEVRNNMMYASHIMDGFMSIIDVSNPANPVSKGTVVTPLKFTHNTWLTTDNKYVFTTDEKPNSTLTCYDITDPANIKEVDRIQSNPGSNSVVHNTYIKEVDRNDFAVTSWYRDGVTIVDAGRPHNLIQVGNYDCYPQGSGSGFDGTWGVYAYFPSGIMIASNTKDGLDVLKPTYVRASYLEGTVTDSVTKNVLNGVKVEILSTTVTENTNVSGKYATGLAQPGTYDISYSKAGYNTKVLKGVALQSGNVALKDVKLIPKNFSVGELDASDYYLNAYPSPFTQSFQIDFKLFKSNVQSKLFITDITGRVVESVNLNGSDGTVRLGNNLSSGMYFIRLEANGAYSASLKVIKNN